MKKFLILLLAIIIGGGFYVYSALVVKKDGAYIIKTENLFAFANLKIDALEWIRDNPSGLFDELSMIKDQRYVTLSGWVEFDEEVKSVYLYNADFGSIYMRQDGGLTRIVFKDYGVFNQAIELYSRSTGVIKDDINYSKISYETFVSLPVRFYSILKELDSNHMISVSTPLTIEEIIKTGGFKDLLHQEWWSSATAVTLPL